MTNVQFISLLSTAIGSFVLVILAWLHQNQRLSDLRANTNRQFADSRADTNRQFAEVKTSLATLTSDYQHFYGMEQKLEGRVDELSKRLK